MFLKLTLYSIPTRTLPLRLNTLKHGTINKQSAPINIIRSPHIDKKSWEQFRFFSQKKTVILKHHPDSKRLLQLMHTLQKLFAVIRITANSCHQRDFQTRF